MPTIEQIADKVVRVMERTITNEIPSETCPVKREKVNWKREKVREEINRRLNMTSVGPTQIK